MKVDFTDPHRNKLVVLKKCCVKKALATTRFGTKFADTDHLITMPPCHFRSAHLRLPRSISFFAIATLAAFCLASAAPFRLHPENGRYFEINGKAGVLVGSTEHYGALINTDFDYLKYLDETQACGLNYVRVFSGAYREVAGSFGIQDNTLFPKPEHLILPWERSEVPGAADGGNKFDLNRWNPAYFHRLREFVKAAQERDIVVELTLFSAYYLLNNLPQHWQITPLNGNNNINGVGNSTDIAAFQVGSDLVPFQKALARKCVEELLGFDNVIFEVMNEPYWRDVPMEWQELIVEEIAAADAQSASPRPIALNIANREAVVTEIHPAVSIINFHYALPNAALANLGLNRVLGNDETGSFFVPAGLGRHDYPYRREAWEFMLSGGALTNHLDYSFTTTSEYGQASQDAPGGGGPAIRRQLGLLKWFLEQLPLVRCQPQPGLVTAGIPVGGSFAALGAPGEAYGIYVQGGTSSSLTLDLPEGTWSGRWVHTKEASGFTPVAAFEHAGGSVVLPAPPFSLDVALLLFNGSTPPPVVELVSPVYQSVVSADQELVLEASATIENGTIERVEFFEGSRLLGSVTSAPYRLTTTDLRAGPRAIRAKVVGSDGRSAYSPPTKCFVAGPFHSGVNLNGSALDIEGNPIRAEQEAKDSGLEIGNFGYTEMSSQIPVFPELPASKRQLVGRQIRRGNSPNNEPMTIAEPLPAGTYDVFLYLVEGEEAYKRKMIVTIEGRQVASGINHQDIGEWIPYGPFRTEVSDGVLNVDLQRLGVPNVGWTPKIAGFSIFRAEPSQAGPDVSLELRQEKGVVVLGFPSSVSANRIESSPSLDAEDWQVLDLPVSDFGDRLEVVAPANHPRQFFRLRKE